MSQHKYHTVQTLTPAYHALKQLAAITGEHMSVIIARLVTRELQRVQEAGEARDWLADAERQLEAAGRIARRVQQNRAEGTRGETHADSNP